MNVSPPNLPQANPPDLTSPGILLVTGTILFGVVVYHVDEYTAAKYFDGKSLVKRFSELSSSNPPLSEIDLAAYEEMKRAKVMRHWSLQQRPIVRSTYPEYDSWMGRGVNCRHANLGNAYGLGPGDKQSKTKRAKNEWE
jgi:hypothetical protein